MDTYSYTTSEVRWSCDGIYLSSVGIAHFPFGMFSALLKRKSHGIGVQIAYSLCIFYQTESVTNMVDGHMAKGQKSQKAESMKLLVQDQGASIQ